MGKTMVRGSDSNGRDSTPPVTEPIPLGNGIWAISEQPKLLHHISAHSPCPCSHSGSHDEGASQNYCPCCAQPCSYGTSAQYSLLGTTQACTTCQDKCATQAQRYQTNHSAHLHWLTSLVQTSWVTRSAHGTRPVYKFVTRYPGFTGQSVSTGHF